MKSSIMSFAEVENAIAQYAIELEREYYTMRDDYGYDPFDPANAYLFD